LNKLSDRLWHHCPTIATSIINRESKQLSSCSLGITRDNVNDSGGRIGIDCSVANGSDPLVAVQPIKQAHPSF